MAFLTYHVVSNIEITYLGDIFHQQFVHTTLAQLVIHRSHRVYLSADKKFLCKLSFFKIASILNVNYELQRLDGGSCVTVWCTTEFGLNKMTNFSHIVCQAHF